MKKHILMMIIIALCLVSIITGIFTATKKAGEIKSADKKVSGNISKIMPSGFDKVALITLSGVISPDNGGKFYFSDAASTAATLKNINDAAKDNSVKGIIIKTDSPGGTVGMSQNLYYAILRARKNKPVIVAAQDVMASGGYYAACAADRIFALPGTITGSIGVIMTSPDFHKLLNEKLSVYENVIKSGQFKDMGSSSRAMTQNERELLQTIVNDSYEQFVTAIKKARVDRNDAYSAPKTVLTEENLKKYADGRIFTGKQAKAYGFVDALGDMDDVEKTMKSMVKEKFPWVRDVEFVKYGTQGGFWEALFPTATESSIEKYIPTSMKFSRKPLYLWE